MGRAGRGPGEVQRAGATDTCADRLPRWLLRHAPCQLLSCRSPIVATVPLYLPMLLQAVSVADILTRVNAISTKYEHYDDENNVRSRPPGWPPLRLPAPSSFSLPRRARSPPPPRAFPPRASPSCDMELTRGFRASLSQRLRTNRRLPARERPVDSTARAAAEGAGSVRAPLRPTAAGGTGA